VCRYSLVRAVHGGAAAAARLATPEGCGAAAQLVAQLENAAVASPEVFHRALSSMAPRDDPPSRRRVKLHRAMLQQVLRALLPARGGDAESARLLVACLDSPAGVHAGRVVCSFE
jgi:muramoyltetrapeptide carboxypeptidase LdcA involved in peptidoglycan recycling